MPHFSHVTSAHVQGVQGNIVDVEVDVTKGTLQAFNIVGLPDKAVEEARDRVSAAIKHTGFTSPKNQNQKVVISLAPADTKKEGVFFDVPMALGYLLAVKEIALDPTDTLFVGEISLDGNIRGVKGILPIVERARKEGFRRIFVPKENALQAATIPHIEVYGVETLAKLIGHINTKDLPHIPRTTLPAQPPQPYEPKDPPHNIDFRDIRGQEDAKRALIIAAAGGHNVCLYGPPGTGKTMLVKAFSSILPALSFDDALEVTGIHSAAGTVSELLITYPPLRTPHHTASHTAIIGGGAHPKPGEITLAHKGVLFLDEFPEFDRRVLEALRQPLEEGVIHVSRTRGTEIFPAHIILVAAMNPCPCGYFGSSKKECRCTPSQLMRYQHKVSGPIMDRIDLWVYVGEVEYETLAIPGTGTESSEAKMLVRNARELQAARFAKTQSTTNAKMTSSDIDAHINLSSSARDTLNTAATSLNLSPRAYHKVIKVARTITDIGGRDDIEPKDILEAIRYRPQQIQT